MKPIIQKFWTAIAMLCFSVPAFAYDFEADGYYFNITDETNKEVEVTYKDDSYNSYSGVANIPEKVNYNGNTYTVHSIGEHAFGRCTNLLSVTIPNTVIDIEMQAFYDCINLRSVTMGAALKNIGGGAFSYRKNSSSSEKYWIPKVIWLCNTLPQGTTEVNAEIEYASTNLFGRARVYPFLSSKFEIDGVIYVPVSPSDRTCDVIDCNYAPANTEIKIDEVVVNKGVELKVIDVNGYSFYKNSRITDLLVNNNGDIGYQSFYGCQGLKRVSFGNHITTISMGAFQNCSTLPTISIPDNIIHFDERIFKGCSSLETVHFGKGLAGIPSNTFENCTSIKSLSIPSNINFISSGAFGGCTSLSDVVIEGFDKDVVQSFPDWSSDNHNDNSISYKEYTFDVIPGDVLTFDYSVSSEGYDYLTIKLGTEQIVRVSGDKSGSYIKVFNTGGQITLYIAYTKDNSNSSGADEASVTNIVLNGAHLNLGSNSYKQPLFSDCPLDEVYIGRKLSYSTDEDYGYSPFYRNTSLRSVKITDAETQIYDNEFYGCSNLQEFSCGDGVESIGKWAFSGCSAMKSYASGSNVKTIGDEAFSDCTGLTSFSTSAAVPPTCGNQALDDINKWECVLHVPSESIDDYKAADQWKEFFFVEPTSGIENIAVDGTEVKVSVGDGGFSFGGDAERNVEVYSIDGQLQYSATVQPGEKVSLPAGLYIVRIGTQTVKVRI